MEAINENTDYTVVEAFLHVNGLEKDEHLHAAVSDYLELCGHVGEQCTEKFDQVNHFGVTEEGKYLLTFLGESHDFAGIRDSVETFLKKFIHEFAIEDEKESWQDIMDVEKLPTVASYEIICVRKYDW